MENRLENRLQHVYSKIKRKYETRSVNDELKTVLEDFKKTTSSLNKEDVQKRTSINTVQFTENDFEKQKVNIKNRLFSKVKQPGKKCSICFSYLYKHKVGFLETYNSRIEQAVNCHDTFSNRSSQGLSEYILHLPLSSKLRLK